MLNIGIRDMADSLMRLPMACYFAWSDTRARYRRSALGPLWMVIGTGVGVAGLGLLWIILLNHQKDTFTFIRNAAVIKNMETPFFVFPLQTLLKNIINFSHNIIVILVVLAIFPPQFGLAQLLIIPGLILTVLNLFWIVSFVALLGTRFRDMEPIISALMPLLFFLSPVLYKPDQLGIAESIAWFNPFSYFIALIRDPIQGEIPPYFVYAGASIMLIPGWFVTLKLFSSKSKKIPLWL